MAAVELRTPAAKVSWLPHAIVAGVLAVCVALYFQIQSATEDPGVRTPMHLVLPAGFTGNIKILYETPGAPEIPVVDGFRRLELGPANTRVVETSPGVFAMIHETSSAPEYGFALDKFERRTLAGGVETITPDQFRERKNGLEGDRREFFNDAREVEHRNRRLVEAGLKQPGGDPPLGRPYEILVLRDNL